MPKLFHCGDDLRCTLQQGWWSGAGSHAIEELRQRGPSSRRNVAWWGRMGESAIALGCLGAAVTGQVQLGLPCVLGGAITSAGLRWWSTRE